MPLRPTNASTDCPVIAETPDDASCFFGFHDVSPWNPADDCLVVLRAPEMQAGLPGGDAVAEVCLWRPGPGTIEPIGATRAWNWQQGARAQWLPGGNRLIYNAMTMDGNTGTVGAVLYDVDSGSEAALPGPIGALSPDGATSIAPDYGRLARYWPAYGYGGSRAPASIESQAPADDGLWQMDLASGARTLFVSVRDAVAVGSASPTNADHFLSHASFSPSGKRVAFLHRYFTRDGGFYTRMIVCNNDGAHLRILAEEKVSHFDWFGDESIAVWTRPGGGRLAAARRSGLLANPLLKPLVNVARRLKPGLKQAMLREFYFMIPVDDPKARRPIGQGQLEQDGHPMFSKDRRWMLTDTYANSDGLQTLILFDMKAGARIDIGHFNHNPGSTDSDLKCDLHPRWNRAGTQVCIDAARGGTRQCLIVDVTKVAGAAALDEAA